jgi:hypothetical protein
MVPLDLFSAKITPAQETAIDYPTDNSNGPDTLGVPLGCVIGTANTDTVVSLSNSLFDDPAHQRWVIGWIVYSYSATPTAGRLRIKDTTTNDVILDIDVSATGKDFLWFQQAIRFKPGSTIEVRLFAGGASVVGKLNVHFWYIK